MSLLSQIQQTTVHARAVGALHSLTTAQTIVLDHGIPFVVRILERLDQKENYQAQKVQEKVNPFLPYEQDLFVCDLSASHVCLLNKFNAAMFLIFFVFGTILFVWYTFGRKDAYLLPEFASCNLKKTGSLIGVPRVIDL